MMAQKYRYWFLRALLPLETVRNNGSPTQDRGSYRDETIFSYGSDDRHDERIFHLCYRAGGNPHEYQNHSRYDGCRSYPILIGI
jgi:hypothetical protein